MTYDEDHPFQSAAEERSLADPPREEPSTERDASPALNLTNFDLDAWVLGVRPTRRSVKLYPQADLVARMEQLADQIDSTPKDVDVDDLLAEFERLRTQFRDGVWFTVERRSSEWEKHFRTTTAKRLGMTLDKDGDPVGQDDTMTLVLHQMVEQIIGPPGVTYAHLRSLYEANEGELTKLLNTWQNVQRNLAESAGVLKRDFSGRRSPERRTS